MTRRVKAKKRKLKVMVGLDDKKTRRRSAISKEDAQGKRCPITPHDAKEIRHASIEIVLTVAGRRGQDKIMELAQSFLKQRPAIAIDVLRLTLEEMATSSLLTLGKAFAHEYEHGEAEEAEITRPVA